MKNPAAGGGRWVDVSPERLVSWIVTFTQRHGPGSVWRDESGTAVTFTAADGAAAECHPPFPPLSPAARPDPGPAAAAAAMAAHAMADRTVGVLLVRLGGYAVGVFAGSPPRLENSKVGGRPDGSSPVTDAVDELKAKSKDLVSALKAHLGRAKAGDYVAMLAYIDRTPAHITAMQKMRHAVRDKKKLATCLGFGPRFLHSTGQAYKGGPNSGVFLQITTSDPADLPVPGARYTFGVVKAAQARGDFDVLADRGRRALRVHLSGGVEAGLKTLASALEQALK